MFYDETGLPWVMPSPNISDARQHDRLSGRGAVRGHDALGGRGTTRPFELIGAPWIDGERLAARHERARLPGVHFRPAFFEPTFQKHARQTCGGCQLHVTDRERSSRSASRSN